MIFISMASHHKPRFEKEARGKSEMAYCILPFLLSSPSSLLKLFKGVRGKGAHLGVPLFELNMALFLWTGGYQ